METVSGYLTLAEIAMLYEVPNGTLRWLAHRDRWERSGDQKRPVLYLSKDVRKTMETRATAAAT
jgi:hypothetical protein